MKSIESSSKESSAIRRPSLLSLLQGRPKPPAYDEKDVEMAEKTTKDGQLQEYSLRIISWEEFYSFVLKPIDSLFLSEPDELAFDDKLFEVINTTNGEHNCIHVDDLLVAGRSQAIAQYVVKNRLSPTLAYLILASSGESVTIAPAASPLTDVRLVSSAPKDSEDNSNLEEVQDTNFTRKVSANTTVRSQRAAVLAAAGIQAAFAEVVGDKETISKAQWHTFLAALRNQRVSQVQQTMLIKRRCFFGIGLEHTNLVHGDSNLISSNWCCNLDRGWLFDFWHYAMHHHPLLQLAQVAAPAPIPTTFVLSPRWHRLLDFSSFSCVTLLATVLLLFYGNLASHKLNAALGLKGIEDDGLANDDHGGVYSSSANDGASEPSSNRAAQAISAVLKLLFVALPAMGQHILNLQSWEHLPCLQRICHQTSSYLNNSQAKRKVLYCSSEALDEMGPSFLNHAISIGCFVATISIWLVYGSFENAPAEYWYEVLSFFPQTWLFWFVYTACAQFNPSPCVVAALTCNGRLGYLGIGQWQRERRQAHAAVRRLMTKRGNNVIATSESPTDVTNDGNNRSPKHNGEDFENDRDFEEVGIENGVNLHSEISFSDKTLLAIEPTATAAAMAAAEARAVAAECSATAATSQLDALMLECNELNLSLSKEVSVRAALEDEVEALRRVVRGALGSSGAPDNGPGDIEDQGSCEEGSNGTASRPLSPETPVEGKTVAAAPPEMPGEDTAATSSLTPRPSSFRRSSSTSSSSSQQPLESVQSVAADSLIRLYAERTRWVAAQADVTAGQERRTQRLLAKRMAAERTAVVVAATTPGEAADTAQSEPRAQNSNTVNSQEPSSIAKTIAANLTASHPAAMQEASDVKVNCSVHAETQTDELLPPVPVPATTSGTQTDEIFPKPREVERVSLPLLTAAINFAPNEGVPTDTSERAPHDAADLPQLDSTSSDHATVELSCKTAFDANSTEQADSVCLSSEPAFAAVVHATPAAADAGESIVNGDHKPETETSAFDHDTVVNDSCSPVAQDDHNPPSTPVDRGHLLPQQSQDTEPRTVPMTTQSAVKRALAARNAHKHLVLKHSSPFRHSSHGHGARSAPRDSSNSFSDALNVSSNYGSDIDSSNYDHVGAPTSPFSFEGGALGRLTWTPSILQPALATSPMHRSSDGLPRASRTWRSESSMASTPERKRSVSATSADAALQSPTSGNGLSRAPNRRSMPSPLTRNARVGIAP